MRINFGDLVIGDTAKKYLQKAIDKNWVSEGDNVKQFEKEFAELFGYKYAIATSSGTDADIVACSSLYDFGANRGDEIIVPSLCFVAAANSILAAGFIPKFVDVELETLNIDPLKIEEAITEKTRAIMVVHTMGKPCEMDTILKIAQKHNLKVIEDACEAHGATYKGKVVGTIGDMGAFSFYTAHQIICGEGGMVATNDEKIADVVRSVKSHGRPVGNLYFDFQRVGYNSKMNDLEAALGLEGIETFKGFFTTRKNNLYRLLDLTKELSEYFYFIKEEDYEKISPHAFPLVLKDEKSDRDQLYKYLESNGIQCKTLFGSLPTQHTVYKFLNYKFGDFPVSEYIGQNGLHFGMHQYLSDDDLVFISDTLIKYFNK
ncbi:Glutamine--scyllo-inositol transaminase [Methanolacinia petrolearia DSM 11571]|uniref:Glutamine--scyllo-inositol transaminase n=1 Tax=Methanolacinia petrolearia (strain DSM 11571 / OCM 486 / SEBR 4847) TaxID=679926 RepID=E1REY1_METP4|nr:DegT/DnrJ/EryC1/StrS family aminotransferase [Methanolacinia petrolearia]ADN36152.1 Glutamine--scyllo-inositol transaminase [Methanolacinia petrolearia DSM 11571]